MRSKLLYLLLIFCFSVNYAQDNVYDIARKGCADDMKQLIKSYPNLINYKNKNGHTPLILACYSGNMEVIEVLVDQVDDLDALSNEGTALMAATFKGNIEISKLLLEHGADVNATDLNGNTALHFAVRFTNPEIIKLLMDYKADVNVLDVKKMSPLDYAKRDKNENILKLLIK